MAAAFAVLDRLADLGSNGLQQLVPGLELYATGGHPRCHGATLPQRRRDSGGAFHTHSSLALGLSPLTICGRHFSVATISSYFEKEGESACQALTITQRPSKTMSK